jgi:pentatricopeptide repeat protein
MSLPNSFLRLWAARVASKLALCTAMTYDLYQLSRARGKDGSIKLGRNEEKRRSLAQNTKGERRTVEDVFIESLVAAGFCRHHAAVRPLGLERPLSFPTSRCRNWDKRSFPEPRRFSTHCRRESAAPAPAPAPAVLPADEDITREEYKDLVNTYGNPEELSGPADRQAHMPLAPRLVIPPDKEDKPPFAARQILPPEDAIHAEQIKSLRRFLVGEKGKIPLAKMWDVYQSLRAPRLRYLADDDIRRAFSHLSWVEFKHSDGAMPRYFGLLDECVSEDIPLTQNEWNGAIAFAGHWVRHVTSSEVKRAVETWMRMERHNVQADNVTFNILFDVAVKAGRYALADTIHNELKSRDMPLTRYFRTSMIYYAGMRGDGEAVRQAFRDLVNAGEIVDTAIMNCVILSLVRAGEPAAAENVFAKMKRLYEQKMGADSLRRWREQKELGRLLNKAATRLRKEKKKHESSFFGSQYSSDDHREELQKATPIAPNARTYRILIQHHAYTSGDIDRVRELLDEMKEKGFHIHGSVYVHILRGFWQHGGFAYTGWSRTRLESLWGEFLAASESTVIDVEGNEVEPSEEDRSPYFTTSVAHSALRAFYKCAGVKRMQAVWDEIKARWKDRDAEDEVQVQGTVDKLVRADSIYIN